jgi:hypothetical protein
MVLHTILAGCGAAAGDGVKGWCAGWLVTAARELCATVVGWRPGVAGSPSLSLSVGVVTASGGVAWLVRHASALDALLSLNAAAASASMGEGVSLGQCVHAAVASQPATRAPVASGKSQHRLSVAWAGAWPAAADVAAHAAALLCGHAPARLDIVRLVVPAARPRGVDGAVDHAAAAAAFRRQLLREARAPDDAGRLSVAAVPCEVDAAAAMGKQWAAAAVPPTLLDLEWPTGRVVTVHVRPTVVGGDGSPLLPPKLTITHCAPIDSVPSSCVMGPGWWVRSARTPATVLWPPGMPATLAVMCTGTVIIPPPAGASSTSAPTLPPLTVAYALLRGDDAPSGMVLSLVRLATRESYCPLPSEWLEPSGVPASAALPGEPPLPEAAYSPMAVTCGVADVLTATGMPDRAAEGPLEDVLRGASFPRGVLPLLQASGLLGALRVLKPAATTKEQRRAALGLPSEAATAVAPSTPGAAVLPRPKAGKGGGGRRSAPAEPPLPSATHTAPPSDGELDDETLLELAEALDPDVAVVAGLDLDDELLAAVMLDGGGASTALASVDATVGAHLDAVTPPLHLRTGLAKRLAAGRMRIGGGGTAHGDAGW